MTATAIVIAQSGWIISTLFLNYYLANRSLNIASDRMLCGSLTIATDIREPRGWPVSHCHCPLAASSIFE
jgi:hypothetical protein